VERENVTVFLLQGSVGAHIKQFAHNGQLTQVLLCQKLYLKNSVEIRLSYCKNKKCAVFFTHGILY